MGHFGTKHGSKIGQKRRVFPKVIPDHLGCSNKCFEPIWSPFGPRLAPSTTCMHHFVPFARTLEPSLRACYRVLPRDGSVRTTKL